MLKFFAGRRLESLYESIRMGRVEELRKHISKRPQDANTEDQNGRTPLIVAAESGQLEALEVLVQSKASLNHQDSAGKTAPMRAAENGKLQAARFLIKSGADARL